MGKEGLDKMGHKIVKKKELIVLCGTSNCGKSTYAKKLKGYALINSDTIRLHLTGTTALGEREGEVWGLFNALKLDSKKKGENVILDACHISSQARWHALQDMDEYYKICVLFDVRLKTVKKRCGMRWAIEMWRDFQEVKPTKADLLYEGFDEVRIIREGER